MSIRCNLANEQDLKPFFSFWLRPQTLSLPTLTGCSQTRCRPPRRTQTRTRSYCVYSSSQASFPLLHCSARCRAKQGSITQWHVASHYVNTVHQTSNQACKSWSYSNTTFRFLALASLTLSSSSSCLSAPLPQTRSLPRSPRSQMPNRSPRCRCRSLSRWQSPTLEEKRSESEGEKVGRARREGRIHCGIRYPAGIILKFYFENQFLNQGQKSYGWWQEQSQQPLCYHCQPTPWAQTRPPNLSRMASPPSSPSSSLGCCIWSIQAPGGVSRVQSAACCTGVTPPLQTEAETWADYSTVAWPWRPLPGVMQPNEASPPRCRSAFRSHSETTNSVQTRLMLVWSLIFRNQHQVMPSWPVAVMVLFY